MLSTFISFHKVYERLLSEHMAAYSETFLSPYLCRFHKGYNAQQALVRFVEKFKSALDRKEFAGAKLMELSKAFHCLNHELLIAKLSAYSFSRPALKVIYSSLYERQQRHKVNGSLSTLKQTSLEVPQGSVLRALFVNIFTNDFFYLAKDTEICNYADDTTIFAYGSNMCSILKSLEGMHPYYLFGLKITI